MRNALNRFYIIIIVCVILCFWWKKSAAVTAAWVCGACQTSFSNIILQEKFRFLMQNFDAIFPLSFVNIHFAEPPQLWPLEVRKVEIDCTWSGFFCIIFLQNEGWIYIEKKNVKLRIPLIPVFIQLGEMWSFLGKICITTRKINEMNGVAGQT